MSIPDGWVREPGPTGPDADAHWTLRIDGNWYDAAWLPPGLEAAILASRDSEVAAVRRRVRLWQQVAHQTALKLRDAVAK